MFRVEGLTEPEIWELGEAHIILAPGSPLHARADLSVEQVNRVGLRVESAEPPIRHANITNWPLEKDQWMSRAQDLAAVAILRLRQTSPVV